MKKLKCFLAFVISIFISLSFVNAECTDEELTSEKKEAEKIKIVYKHMGKLEENGEEVYNKFLVTASNIKEGLYIHMYPFATENFIENEDNVQIHLTTGVWHYYIYSSKCSTQVNDIVIKLPKFNKNSLDPLCENVDSEDFELCDKYYRYDVDYETFKAKVTLYRQKKDIDNKNTNKDSKFNITSILKSVLEFIIQYKLYVLISLGVILIIISIILITSRNRKRKILN